MIELSIDLVFEESMLVSGGYSSVGSLVTVRVKRSICGKLCLDLSRKRRRRLRRSSDFFCGVEALQAETAG